jgi:hypothetical protein
MRAKGSLTRLDTAFSRDHAGKIYVQDRMLENTKELWAWLEAGAHFLARCGEWSAKFLDTLWFLGDVKENPDRFGPKWEQNTIKHVLQHLAGFAERSVVLPQRALNSSLQVFQKGDFILHLGVMANGNRLRTLREAQKWMVT